MFQNAEIIIHLHLWVVRIKYHQSCTRIRLFFLSLDSHVSDASTFLCGGRVLECPETAKHFFLLFLTPSSRPMWDVSVVSLSLPHFCHSVSPGVKPAPSLSQRPVWTGFQGSAFCLLRNLERGSCGVVMIRQRGLERPRVRSLNQKYKLVCIYLAKMINYTVISEFFKWMPTIHSALT